ncbi:MAG: redoxin domain-containing protein [Planctomycetaceae bacterium]|nr:redoxin domain-containing protein [Planctomycetaceae bacterium]
MSRRWVLPIASVLIAGLCAWRMSRPPRPTPQVSPSTPRALPPRGWELPDHEFRLVKFDRFLGRHPVVVRFFDGSQPAEEDELLVWLRDNDDELNDAGWQTIAISTARPAEVRASEERTGKLWPFPVLTDMHLRDPAPAPVHHLWSRVNRETGELLPAVFLVDRMGYVDYENGRPKPIEHPLPTLEALIAR